MATHTFVELTCPEGETLADLTGVKLDLESAKEFSLKLQNMLSPYPNDPLIDPLSTAVLVRYFRAFGTGVRKKGQKILEEEGLQQLTDEQQKTHKYFKDFRNKHIAHSVNCFEENVVKAWYCVERVKEEGINDIGCDSNRVISLSLDDTYWMVELTDVLIKFVNRKIKDEKARLLKFVRAMPLEEVLSKGMGSADFGNGPVDKSRKPKKNV